MISPDVFREIMTSRKVALLTHTSPDGDAIGSCLGLAHSLWILGKHVDLYCQDIPPDNYDFLEGVELFRRIMPPQEWYDIAIALDCSDLERIGLLSGIMKYSNKTINIDHHITNSHFADINIVDINSGATAEIIFEVVKSLTGSPSLSAAEALYTGIVTDTGNFSYSNATPKTHRIAAELMEQGVDVDKITTLIYKNHSLGKIKLWGRAIETLELSSEGKAAMISITLNMMESNGTKDFDAEGVINFALDIKGVELAVLLRELSYGNVKVSFRSKTLLDVSNIASQFGGGGHRKAAGCIMKENINQVKDIMQIAIRNIFSEIKP